MKNSTLKQNLKAAGKFTAIAVAGAAIGTLVSVGLTKLINRS